MNEQINSQPTVKKIKLDFKDSKYATGRRKKSIAKVWVKKGSGNIHVNGKKINEYFNKFNLQIAIRRPLTIAKRENEYDVFLLSFCGKQRHTLTSYTFHRIGRKNGCGKNQRTQTSQKQR